MRYRAWLMVGMTALLVGWTPRVWGQRSEGAAVPSAAEDKVSDYRGKGEVTISLDGSQKQAPLSLSFAMEQAFRRPGTILLSLNLAGAGLSQTFLTEGDVEQSYNPVQGLIIEKRYKNLDKAMANPLTAVQASMYDLGRKIQKATSRHEVGTETKLGYACDILEVASQEIFQDIAAGNLLGNQRGSELFKGRTKVWLLHDFGLPVRLELYAGTEKPALTVAFTELKVNSGLGGSDIRLGAPAGTRKVSVTADLADPNWEMKMENELRDLVAQAREEKPAQKRSLAP